MSEKAISRMRVFAGPNGSGKSTIIKEIQKIVNTGTYINADDIEKSSKEKRFINFRLVVKIEDGDTVKILSDEMPVWVETYILEKLGV